MKKLILLSMSAVFVMTAFAVEDEPDELNWDTLGGTVTGFSHFRDYCKGDSDFRRKLMAEKPVVKVGAEPTVVRVKGSDFAKAPLKQWHEGEIEGEKCIILQGGHNGLMVRTGVDIPKGGWYRVWVKYHHTQGTIGSFELSIEDGRLAGQSDPGITVVQDAFTWRYDAAEFGRKQNFLPNHRDEPTGWIWEASPMVRLEKGRRAVALKGLTHDGPYAERRVAEIVLSTDPIAKPGERPSLGEAGVRDLWARRPMSGAKPSPELKRLWRKWRKAFIADLAEGRLAGVEAGRMAGTVYFDEGENLIGTPKQVADGKAEMRKFLAGIDRTHFKCKVECEEFEVKNGWYQSAGGGSSGGKHLTAGYGGEEADAWKDVTVPSNGTYNVWLRYNEVGGYLAGWHFRVEEMDGTVLGDRYLQSDWTENQAHPGMSWIKLPLELEKGKVRLRLYKQEGGSTYRHVDAAIVTDDLAYVPEGGGVALPPLAKEPLTVWRQYDPWIGFSQTEGPRETEDLDPYDVEVRDGETATVLVLVRNNTQKHREITPKVKGDANGLLRWRVVAFSLAGWGAWTPQHLLEREQVFAPPEQTVGLWISIRGDRRAKKESVRFSVGEHELVLNVKVLDAHPDTVPVPYVYGWAVPWKTVSNWETFRDLGVNVIGEALVSKAEAAKYGIRLTTHLNDGDVRPEHIREVKSRYAKLGYDVKDWAWSFMDEPNNSMSDGWVELAKKFRAVDKDIRIWVNPGEIFGAGPESNMKMTPYVNCYCPYADHFWNIHMNGDYAAQLRRQGPKFDILMSYTTPCFWEKAPSSTNDMLSMVDFALQNNLDGWGFFAFAYGFTYCNSMWDEVNNYMNDQCIYIYPGAANRTILTRNAEALREAVQRWRAAKASAQNGERK